MLLTPGTLPAEQQMGMPLPIYHHDSFWEIMILFSLITIGILGGGVSRYRKMKELNQRLQNMLTLKEKAEAEAEAESNKFFRVVNNSPVSIVITNPRGIIEYVNPMFCEDTGYTSEEVIGKNSAILKSGQTPAEVYQDLWQTITTGEVWQGKLRNKKKDGTLFWENATIGAIRDKNNNITQYIGIKENISHNVSIEQELLSYRSHLEEIIEHRTEELEQALQRAKAAQSRINSILASVAEGLLVTDKNDKIILTNKVAERLFKMQAEDLNTTLQTLLAKHALSIIDLNNEEGAASKRFDIELPTEDYMGIRVLQATTSQVYDQLGTEVGGKVTLFHDITRERELDRLKTEFVSTAAHELRTPLTSIRGFSELLLERTFSPEEEKTFLFYINQQSKYLTNIINDLLDVSRIESGLGFVLTKKETPINPILRGVVAFYQQMGTGHDYHLHLEEMDSFLVIDKEKIVQALQNILSNAVKYSPNCGEITITGKANEETYRIEITDQGIGMSPDQVTHIFDKFYRADSSNTAIEGTGLGMGIVRYIVEAHGGEIIIQSQPDVGTTVILTLPSGEQ
jgi:PAS domain S-box-containing protein